MAAKVMSNGADPAMLDEPSAEEAGDAVVHPLIEKKGEHETGELLERIEDLTSQLTTSDQIMREMGSNERDREDMLRQMHTEREERSDIMWALLDSVLRSSPKKLLDLRH